MARAQDTSHEISKYTSLPVAFHRTSPLDSCPCLLPRRLGTEEPAVSISNAPVADAEALRTHKLLHR